MARKPVMMVGFEDLIALLRGDTVEGSGADLIPSNEILDARETVNKQIIQLIAIYQKEARKPK